MKRAYYLVLGVALGLTILTKIFSWDRAFRFAATALVAAAIYPLGKQRWSTLPRLSLMGRGTEPGHCPTCGYDLRATPNRCPECGAIPTNMKD